MKDTVPSKLINGIPEQEYSTVLKILTRYNLDIMNISKVRNVYKVNSSKGIKCLKYIKNKKHKPKKTFYFTQYLLKKDFNNIAKFITTIDNKPFVKYKDTYFYMTDWISGRECNVGNFNELISCVELLANFHIAASGKEGRKYFKVDSNLKNWPILLMNRCNDIIRYERMIDNKKIKSEFDSKYKDNIAYFHKLGIAAVNLLNEFNYYEISKKARSERSICHDSFYYQNLIVDDNGNIYLIDLDSVIKDIRMHDLGKFIRRILFRKEYEWKFDFARDLINIYSSVIHISKEELGVLLAIIIYPHKFWKLGRRRYDKHKLMGEEKYIKKLDRQIKYLKNEQQFIKEYINHYDINVNIEDYIII